jgi:NAD(P)-dependent dehydrogenase (short-subunit alcohol dehydrogenase family)
MSGPSQGWSVVTGGTRGIGLAISLGLVQAGHRVVAIARHHDDNLPFEVVACDLADPSAIAALFDSLGDVSVLVNNAGLSTSAKVEATTLEDWNRNIALNATAPFLAIQRVLPAMRARGSGRIVTVASTSSLDGFPYVAAYTASKHAVLGLMKVVAAEVRDSGIGAASVCPTYVRTDMTEATITRIAATTGCSYEQASQRLAALTPHGRLVEPDEVALRVLELVRAPVAVMNGAIELVDGAPANDQARWGSGT